MDFGRTQISGLLNDVAHEKTKYTTLLYKLHTILSLNRRNKLIKTAGDALIISESPNILYEHINYKHPIVKILTEHLNRMMATDSAKIFFIRLAESVLEGVRELIEHGRAPKLISNELYEIAGLFKNKSDGLDYESYIKLEIQNEHVSNLLIEAISRTGTVNTENIRICKAPTGDFEDSYLVNGMVVGRRPEGKIQRLFRNKVAIYNTGLDISRTEAKGTVLFRKADELLRFTKEENEDLRKLADSFNCNVLVVSGSINDVLMEYVNSRNILVLRIFNKHDLKRICDVVGGAIYNTLGPAKYKGEVEEIAGFEESGIGFTRIVGGNKTVTLMLKYPLVTVLDEMERKIFELLSYLGRQSKKLKLSDKVNINGEISFSENKAAIAEDIQASEETILGGVKAENFTKKIVAKALLKNQNLTSIKGAERMNCIRSVLEFFSLILEVDDYLVAKGDVLDIKPPAHNEHWDEDH